MIVPQNPAYLIGNPTSQSGALETLPETRGLQRLKIEFDDYYISGPRPLTNVP